MSLSYSLKQIASFLDAEIVGDESTVITGLATLESAKANELAFLSNPKYAKELNSCQAGAVILQSAQAQSFNGNCLIVKDAYLSYAKISAWFDRAPTVEKAIHASATIDPTAIIGDAVSIGPNVVIEAQARIGSGTQIQANSVIGVRSEVGDNCVIAANVTIYHDVRMGSGTRVHSGSVIGADGFGFASKGKDGWQKISQIGGVVIGDNVEVGACTTIDRGAINDTVIGDNVILDNHVQIAHNAIIGDNTAMAAYAGVAGSTVVGKNCVLAAGAHVVGHASLCDNVQIMAHSLVFKDIKQSNSYSNAVMPLMTTAEWSKNSVRMGQLNQISQRLKKLEKKD
ncbi:MAG: UDP-3-O-(3-hydroxymyristoyl)glucosamine N-acyltransferase [Porticoccaceae bacterium]